MRPTLYILTTLALSCAGVVSVHAQTADFDAMVSSFNKDFDSMNRQGRKAIKDLETEYSELEAKINAEYAAFEQEVRETWGEKDAKVTDRYNWVEYSDDKRSRSAVDFESGEVEVELLLTDEELANDALVEQKLSGAVEKLLASKGSTVEYDSKYIPREEISATPIMEDIIDIRAQDIVREAEQSTLTEPQPQPQTQTQPQTMSMSSTADLEREVAALRKEAAALETTAATPKTTKPATTKTTKAATKTTKPTSKTTIAVSTPAPKAAPVVEQVKSVNTASGKQNVVTVKTSLKSGYLGDLAQKYKDKVVATAKRFDISPTLVFAVMETESYFNPTATSHIPAYGLMQIVPKYAGRDAYRLLYGEDKIVSKNFLYQANNNIEMGVGYLNILASRYFKNVESLKNRELCMIAAYNTGAGNVSRAIAGHTNIFKAVPAINKMSYDELYAHLKKHLPYEETQNYIDRVTTKRVKYIEK